MANVSWLTQWTAFSFLAISLGELPVVANALSSHTQKVAQATPLVVVNRAILKLGSQGAEVSELQAALKLLGYFSGTVDGVYGQSTAIAVSRFQQAAGLQADGITGSATWNRLFPSSPSVQIPSPTSSNTPASSFPVPSSIQTTASGLNNFPSTSATNVPTAASPQSTAVALPILRRGMRGPAVAQLQERLKSLGFLQGSVDGVFGATTHAAVQAAQQSFRVQPDGIVGAATWSALLR
jgi:peptidoglycan hydrolase-like protein with peptidoglycan-binding domain